MVRKTKSHHKGNLAIFVNWPRVQNSYDQFCTLVIEMHTHFCVLCNTFGSFMDIEPLKDIYVFEWAWLQSLTYTREDCNQILSKKVGVCPQR